MAKQLNVTKEAVLPACLIADVELSMHGRSLLQDDDDWNEGINSEFAAKSGYHVSCCIPCVLDCWCFRINATVATVTPWCVTVVVDCSNSLNRLAMRPWFQD